MSLAVFYEQDFLEELYAQKQYEKVIKKLINADGLTVGLKKKLGYAYFHNHQFDEAYKIFIEAKADYQAGQCQLLMGNLEKAYEIFDKAEPSSAILWGRCLVELVQMKLSRPPSFLQIRNFLETDLNMLIECGKTEYAENVIRWNRLLADLNSESYKFIGKVLLFNGYYALARDYLERSKETLLNDPETYYYLAWYYNHFNELEITKRLLNKAIEINADYAPAHGMLERLDSVNK